MVPYRSSNNQVESEIKTAILGVQEAKAHLSEYLAQLADGETLIICEGNTPIAEVRRLPEGHDAPRPVGLARDTFSVPPSFFEPLPDDLLRGFQGFGI